MIEEHDMKINEVTIPSKRTLYEEFDVANNSGFTTTVLTEIAEQELAGVWHAPETADELLAEMDRLDAEYDNRTV